MSNQIQQIASRIKELRLIEDVSEIQLSKELNVSLEQYQEYESGEQDIPVSFLCEIASRFGVDLTSIITGDAPKLHSYCLVKNGMGKRVERRKQYEYLHLAFNFSHRKIETFMVTIPGQNVEIDLNTHTGQEFNYVLEGRLQLLIGSHEIIMEPGDSIYFDSSIKHGMKALDGKPSKFLAIVIPT